MDRPSASVYAGFDPKAAARYRQEQQALAARRASTAVARIGVPLAGLLDLLANYLAAHLIIAVGPFLVPAGTFVFALAFATYDALRRWCGLWYAGCAVVLGLLLSAGYVLATGNGRVGQIAVAGLGALVVSSLTDLIVQAQTLRWPVWAYVLTTNAVSLAVDSAVFVAVAFAALPADLRLRLFEGQYGAKVLMTLVSIPLVYAVRRVVRARTGAAMR